MHAAQSDFSEKNWFGGEAGYAAKFQKRVKLWAVQITITSNEVVFLDEYWTMETLMN